MGKKASHHYLTPGSGVELPLLLAFLFFFTHLHLSAILPSSPPTTFFSPPLCHRNPELSCSFHGGGTFNLQIHC